MAMERRQRKLDLNRRAALLVGLAAASALVSSKYANLMAAEAGTKTGQTTVTQLLDNERIQVLRMVSTSGDKGAMRERQDRVLYIIQGAKVRFRYPDGKTEDVVWKTGDVVYQKADKRQVENIDTRDLEYISVRLK